MRRLSVLAVALAVTLLAGCGEDPGPVDDGTDSALQAGAADALVRVGVELVSVEAPVRADVREVQAALSEQDLPAGLAGRDEGSGLEIDPERVAGLLGTVGNLAGAGDGDLGRYVVLVFDEPVSALVHVEADPDVLDGDQQAYYAGNLVGYYVPGGEDESAAFRAALEALSGMPDADLDGSTDGGA